MKSSVKLTQEKQDFWDTWCLLSQAYYWAPTSYCVCVAHCSVAKFWWPTKEDLLQSWLTFLPLSNIRWRRIWDEVLWNWKKKCAMTNERYFHISFINYRSANLNLNQNEWRSGVVITLEKRRSNKNFISWNDGSQIAFFVKSYFENFRALLRENWVNDHYIFINNGPTSKVRIS